MKRIAFVSTMEGSAWGGSENLWARAASQALQHGNQVLASVYKWDSVPSQLANLEKQGAVLHRRKRFAFSSEILSKAANKILRTYVPARGVQRVLQHFQPDSVCISQGGNYDIIQEPALFRAIEKLKVPYFIVPQFNYEHYTLPYNEFIKGRAIFAKAKGICFVSARNREVSRRQLSLPLASSTVILNPPNIDNCQPVIYSPVTDQYHMACVSRLDCNFKGQDVLLQVLGESKWRERNWQLSLFGQGPHEQYLRTLIKFYQLEDKVFLAGHVDDIRKLWAENHLLVMPSIAEGTPCALMEAMICGRAAVATDVGGNAVFVQNNKTGFLAEAPSSVYLGNALEKAWSQRDRWEEMGQAAHRLATDQVPANPGSDLLDYLLQ